MGDLVWLCLVIIAVIILRERFGKTRGTATPTTASSTLSMLLKVLLVISLIFFFINLLFLLYSLSAPLYELSTNGLVPQITFGSRSEIRRSVQTLVYNVAFSGVLFLLAKDISYLMPVRSHVFKKRLIIALFILLGIIVLNNARSLGLGFLAPLADAMKFDNKYEGLLHLSVGVILYLAVAANFFLKKRRPLSPSARNYFIFGALMLLVMASAAFILRTVPNQAEMAIDIKRSTHINEIVVDVFEYYHSQGKLPAALEALNSDEKKVKPVDPITGVPYDYKIDSKDSFEICATYLIDSVYYNPVGRLDLPEHDAGYSCSQLFVPPAYRRDRT